MRSDGEAIGGPEAGVRSAPEAVGRATLPPVFLVGCGRSGTTLLRLMLHAHPEITIPRESHFIYKIARRRALGRWPTDLAARGAWEHLVERLLADPDLRLWEFDRAPLRDRLGALRERTYAAAFRTVFETYLDQHGGRRWGDKTPQHVQYMLVLDRLYPDAQFVHVVRDGRDVALSLLRTEGWGPRHMREAGYYWAWLVLSGVIAGEVLGPERYYQLRYEDLVAAPEATLRALTGWLGHDYRDAMLAYHASASAQRYVEEVRAGRRAPDPGAALTLRPPDPGQLQKWRRTMGANDLRSFLRQAGGVLAYLGYDVDDLPRSQQAVRRRLDALLEPDVVASLARGVRPAGGPEAVRVARLLGERSAQLAALVGRQPASFARASLQWQATVAGLLS